jgi:hypothetical protein
MDDCSDRTISEGLDSTMIIASAQKDGSKIVEGRLGPDQVNLGRK